MLDLSINFKKNFHREPDAMVRAPGRVNLIGEHTDYNDGFVFPLAIDRAVYLAFSPRNDHVIEIVAANFNHQTKIIDLDKLIPPSGKKTWDEYIKGMAWVLQTAFNKPLKGFNAVLHSDLPMGAGLSSSAAFELAIARALAAVNDLPWEPITMARYAQRAENEWIGVKCGIMDQLISAAGVKDHAVLIDCRDLSYEAVPLPQHTAIVIMDTNTKRGLVGSAYNERRQQCEDAATILGVKKLRDATLEQLNKYKAEMPDIVYKRAHHVISENARTVAAKEYLQQNNPAEVGKLMRESHRSLAEDFEVSSTALDAMAHIANAHPACYGARMTGAGFGGCAVALIDAKHSQDFVEAVSTAYQKELSLVPNLYVCHAEDGVELKIN